MHEKIADIQNSIWKAYKDYTRHRDMKQYQADMRKVGVKYQNDPVMLRFYNNLAITWTPVIVVIQQEWNRREQA